MAHEPTLGEDPFFKEAGLRIELGTRHYFMWRFLQHKVNAFWLDTDVHMTRNPYPYLKGDLKGVNLVMRDHYQPRLEINT
eukprot:156018-Prorocentrum_minimum.AAC.1